MPSRQPPVWPLYDVVIFDCDSTLSTIEGIDELARLNGRDEDVAVLTKRAMEGDIPLESVYDRRLNTANPTQEQVYQVARRYRETIVAHAREVIEALQSLGVAVFIVSGGLIEAVRDFGVWLGVPRERIFAVNMAYDQLAGQWWRYWNHPRGRYLGATYLEVEPSPLTGTRGKNQVIARLRAAHAGRAMMIGDGLSDLETAEDVDLFVGFGGVVYRQRIAEAAQVYIHAPTLALVLPLALGPLGRAPRFASVWAEGVRRIQQGDVTFRDAALRTALLTTLRRQTP